LEIRPIVELEKSDVFQSLNQMFQEVGMDMPSNIQEATEQVDRLRANFSECRGELREVEYLFYRMTSLINKLGLPEDVQQAIQILQRLILTIRMMHSAIILLTSMTPYGEILGTIATISAFATMGDTMYEATRGR
jgi:hypothetical protein